MEWNIIKLPLFIKFAAAKLFRRNAFCLQLSVTLKIPRELTTLLLQILHNHSRYLGAILTLFVVMRSVVGTAHGALGGLNYVLLDDAWKSCSLQTAHSRITITESNDMNS